MPWANFTPKAVRAILTYPYNLLAYAWIIAHPQPRAQKELPNQSKFG